MFPSLWLQTWDCLTLCQPPMLTPQSYQCGSIHVYKLSGSFAIISSKSLFRCQASLQRLLATLKTCLLFVFHYYFALLVVCDCLRRRRADQVQQHFGGDHRSSAVSDSNLYSGGIQVPLQYSTVLVLQWDETWGQHMYFFFFSNWNNFSEKSQR